MDATRGTPAELLNELDKWLHSCDICVEEATNPVALACGHFFCCSCLNEAFQEEQEQVRLCPVCGADLLEETAPETIQSSSIGAPAGPTPEDANSEISNARNLGPAARTPMIARTSVISPTRMDVVQDYLEEENGRICNIQLDLSRRVSDLRRERIQELEQALFNLVHMNLAALRAMDACQQDRRRMSRRIEQLETGLLPSEDESLQPTPIPTGNDEAHLRSAEDRLSTTN